MNVYSPFSHRSVSVNGGLADAAVDWRYRCSKVRRLKCNAGPEFLSELPPQLRKTHPGNASSTTLLPQRAWHVERVILVIVNRTLYALTHDAMHPGRPVIYGKNLALAVPLPFPTFFFSGLVHPPSLCDLCLYRSKKSTSSRRDHHRRFLSYISIISPLFT